MHTQRCAHRGKLLFSHDLSYIAPRKTCLRTEGYSLVRDAGRSHVQQSPLLAQVWHTYHPHRAVSRLPSFPPPCLPPLQSSGLSAPTTPQDHPSPSPTEEQGPQQKEWLWNLRKGLPLVNEYEKGQSLLDRVKGSVSGGRRLPTMTLLQNHHIHFLTSHRKAHFRGD